MMALGLALILIFILADDYLHVAHILQILTITDRILIKLAVYRGTVLLKETTPIIVIILVQLLHVHISLFDCLFVISLLV